MQKPIEVGGDESSVQHFWPQMGPNVLLVFIFFLNFIGRVILSPLLPAIERDLRISHTQAGSLFFFIASGYLLGLLGSGFIASRITHKSAIVASSAGVGSALLAVSASASLWPLRVALLGVGLSAGLYMPSAIATITSRVDSRHWGKAIGVHELAPNLAFFLSPFVAELFLSWFTWRSAIAFIGILSLFASLTYRHFGQGGNFLGDSPASAAMRELFSSRAFWLIVVLFGLGVSSTLGVYAMLPLYLISERQMNSTWVNTLVAFSRAHGPFLGLMGGWVSDKLGAKRTIGISLAFTGIVTVALGRFSEPGLSFAVLLQPLLAVWFFPAAFAAMAMMTSPNTRNLAVSFSVPFGFVIGGGLIPTLIGVMGDAGSFAAGYIAAGSLIFGGCAIALFLRLPETKN